MCVSGPERVHVRCSRCERDAAVFAAPSRGEGTALGSRDAEGLQRTGWFGELWMPMPREKALALLARIQSGGLAELWLADRDTYAFHCRRCARPYCQKCWKVGPPRFDDGFYDCTYGTCPDGHEQTLDD